MRRAELIRQLVTKLQPVMPEGVHIEPAGTGVVATTPRDILGFIDLGEDSSGGSLHDAEIREIVSSLLEQLQEILTRRATSPWPQTNAGASVLPPPWVDVGRSDIRFGYSVADSGVITLSIPR